MGELAAASPAIEHWLNDIREHFAAAAPELLSLLETYAAEAAFGRRYIDTDLKRLPRGAQVLEVGAGSLLLSCQLMREGFQMTALEPTGSGFAHFERMRQMVLDKARSSGCCPAILDLPAEALADDCRFLYAFSINVMEHVNDVDAVLANVGRSLTPGGAYRFTCPNYTFPYEPHFDIPTLMSKRLTEKVLGARIFANKAIPDPRGAWHSLNWITVGQVRSSVRQLAGLSVTFNRSMLASAFERIASDQDFASRRSPVMRKLILLLIRLRMHRLFPLVPAALQPIMDCRVEKTCGPGAR